MVQGARIAVNRARIKHAEKTSLQQTLTSSHTSAVSKYMDLAVGAGGPFAFLRYELACWLLAPMPGSLGYLLRGLIYPRLFLSSGKGLVIGRNVCLRHPAMIRLGRSVVIDDDCVLDAKGGSSGGVSIGDGVFIGRNTILSCKGGSIEIGHNSNISAGCTLLSESTLSIGRNVLIAGMTYIVAGGNHGIERVDLPIIAQPCASKGGVRIGDNCWIGAGVTILDGVQIGRDTVVGAGAVVIESLPDFAVAAGVPAKIIRMRR